MNPIQTYIDKRAEEFEKMFIDHDDTTGDWYWRLYATPGNIKSFHSETINTVLAMVREMVRDGNLDTDFEYKKEYYNGHNELQQHLLSQLPSQKQS